MIASLLISRIAIGAVVLSGVGLGAALLVPVPSPAARVWFDQPLDGTVLVQGEHSIRLHLRDEAPLVRIVITRDGEQVGAPGDDSLERVVDAPGRAAWLGEFTWDFTPGIYVLQPLLGTSDDNFSPVTITVVGEATAQPGEREPTPTPTPTESPSLTPTPSATPSETSAPEPSTQPSTSPSVPPSTPPSASPSPSPSASSPPVFAGTVSRVQGANDWVSTFTGSGISPAGAIVNVQVNVRNSNTASFTGWSSTPCVTSGGSTAPFSCTVSNHRIPTPGAMGANAPSYLVVYRLEVIYQGTTYYGTGGNWITLVRIG